RDCSSDVCSSDLVEELVPGKHGVPVLQQQAQELKLLQRQRHILAVHLDQVPPGVHHQLPQLVHRRRRAALPAPAEGGPDPGHQFHHAEGLGYIVVGSASRPTTLSYSLPLAVRRITWIPRVRLSARSFLRMEIPSSSGSMMSSSTTWGSRRSMAAQNSEGRGKPSA